MSGGLSRKGLAGVVIAFSLCFSLWAQPTQTEVNFAWVTEKAKERAAKGYSPQKSDLPEELTKLNYDSYREIRFRHDKALWREEELAFRLEFFHLGYLYQAPVRLHEFTATHQQPIRFTKDFFDYGKIDLKKKLSADSGYAGFRLLYPLNEPGKWDEVASFLGASYFRMLGKGQRYGTSARGLAINSGEKDLPEEFPVFTDWWLGKPEKGSDTLRLYAILDSVSMAGAYEFLLRPGEATVAEVSVVLFMREQNLAKNRNAGHAQIRTLGLAPLTSMFWFGENSESKPDDYRPEVHDCDGLLVRDEQENFVWRPVTNPPEIRQQAFPISNPRGFGLLQRDRQFEKYEDLFNAYHQVPSVWVVPRGNWGEGEISLVELPTKYEGDDNVVAFWNPKAKPTSQSPFKYQYSLHWALRPDSQFPVSRVLQTRIGSDPRDASKRQFVIDFAQTEGSNATPEAEVKSSPDGSVSEIQVFKNDFAKSWRVIFSLKPKDGSEEPIELTCSLKPVGKSKSEEWRYRWDPRSTNLVQK